MREPRVDDLTLAARVAELRSSVDELRASIVPREEYDRRHRRVVWGVVTALLVLAIGAVDFWQQRVTTQEVKSESLRADRVICDMQNQVKAEILRDAREGSAPFPIPPEANGGLRVTIEEANRRIREGLARKETTLAPTPCPSLIRQRLTVASR